MPFTTKKEEENIKQKIRDLIERKLLDGFTDKQERPVIKVDSINLINYDINEEESDRDKLIIQNIYSAPHIWVSNDLSGGMSNDNFEIRTQYPLEFIYDEEQKEYIIRDYDEVSLMHS